VRGCSQGLDGSASKDSLLQRQGPSRWKTLAEVNRRLNETDEEELDGEITQDVSIHALLMFRPSKVPTRWRRCITLLVLEVKTLAEQIGEDSRRPGKGVSLVLPLLR
jgi:hypothetical protein